MNGYCGENTCRVAGRKARSQALIWVSNEGDLDSKIGHWSASQYVLKVALSGIADGLDVRCEGCMVIEGSRTTSKLSHCLNWSSNLLSGIWQK